VLAVVQEQINANKDLVEEGMMRMLDNYDLFTKATIDASIKNIDQVLERGIPDDARMWLGMMGFRVVVNVHGEVIKFDMPGTTQDE
jgi:predicted RNA polymerase sigma factor